MYAFLIFYTTNVNDVRKIKDYHYRFEAAGLGFGELDFVVAHPQ